METRYSTHLGSPIDGSGSVGLGGDTGRSLVGEEQRILNQLSEKTASTYLV